MYIYAAKMARVFQQSPSGTALRPWSPDLLRKLLDDMADDAAEPNAFTQRC